MRMTKEQIQTAAQDLDGAADVIEKYGLAKYQLGNVEKGFCSNGALVQAIGGPEWLHVTLWHSRWHCARRLLAQAVGCLPSFLPDWNNAPERTAAEVICAMRATAMTLRAKVADGTGPEALHADVGRVATEALA